jgi:hypothetical protein
MKRQRGKGMSSYTVNMYDNTSLIILYLNPLYIKTWY